MPTSLDREAPQFDPDGLEEMLGRALARSAEISARHRRRRSLMGSITVGLVMVAVVATVAVKAQAPNASPRSAQPPSAHGGEGSVAPQWKLVDEVSAGWQVLSGPVGAGGLPLIEMTCPWTTTCYAYGPGAVPIGAPRPGSPSPSQPIVRIETTTDGGQTWTRGTLPADLVLDPSGLTCTAGGECVVTGSDDPVPGAGAAAAVYSTDGGVTWSAATLPAGTSALHSVACNGSGFCITSSFGGSSAASILASSDYGATWTDVSAPGLPSTRVPGFFCSTTTDCWAYGSVVPPGSGSAVSVASSQGLLAQSVDGGHTWQSAQLPSTVRAVLSLACPTVTDCYAMAALGTGSGQLTFGLLSDNAGG